MEEGSVLHGCARLGKGIRIVQDNLGNAAAVNQIIRL